MIFNPIKNKYTGPNSSLVPLEEYLICEDETTNDHYLVLKFQNKYKKPLSFMRYEIKEFNEANELLRTDSVDYGDLYLKPNSFFVPFQKIQVLDDCTRVEYRLLNAKFKGYEFKVSTVKCENQNENVLSNPDSRPKLKNIKSRKSMLIPILIFSLLIIVISTILTYYLVDRHMKKTYFFTTDDFSFTVSDNKATITKVWIEENKIVIPSKVYDFEVCDISQEAFEGLNPKSITIEASSITIYNNEFMDMNNLEEFTAKELLEVGARAFSNCTNLKSIKADAILAIDDYAFFDCASLTEYSDDKTSSIGDYAFAGCSLLESFYAPNAVLSNNCLEDTNITSLEYLTSSTTDFGQIFGKMNEEINFDSIIYHGESINDTYFRNINCPSISFSDTCYIGYGAFEGSAVSGYQMNVQYEAINGTLISLKQDLNELIIGPEIKEIRSGAFKNCNLTSIEINSDSISLNNSFNYLNSLDSLVLDDNVKSVKGQINAPINQLTLSANTSSLSELISVTGTSVINITGNSIPDNYLAGISGVNSVIIADTVSQVGNTIFGTDCDIIELRIPNIVKSVADLGEFTSLKSLVITNSDSDELSSYFIQDIPTLENLTLPNNVVEIGLPLIGQNMQSLATLEVNFIGQNAQNSSSIDEFNLSSDYLKELIIAGDFVANKPLNASGIKSLELDGNIDGAKGYLEGCNNLLHLTIKSNILDTTIATLFDENVPSNLSYVTVDSTAALADNYLANTNVKAIELIGANGGIQALSKAYSLEYVYFSSTTSYELQQGLFNQAFDHTITVLYEGRANSALPSGFTKYENIGQDFTLKFSMNNKIYELDELFAYDYEQICQLLNIDESKSATFEISSKPIDLANNVYFTNDVINVIVNSKINLNLASATDIVISLCYDDETIVNTPLKTGESFSAPYLDSSNNRYFAGWYFDSNHTKKVPATYVATSSITLYSYYIDIPYCIATDMAKSYTVPTSGMMKLQLVAKANEDFTIILVGSGIASSSQATSIDVMSGYISLHFKANQYELITINYKGNPNEKLTAIHQTVNSEKSYNETISNGSGYSFISQSYVVGNDISIPTLEGFSFKGYYQSPNGVGICYFNDCGKMVIVPENDCLLYPYFVYND